MSYCSWQETAAACEQPVILAAFACGLCDYRGVNWLCPRHQEEWVRLMIENDGCPYCLGKVSVMICSLASGKTEEWIHE